jgi:hypothetical protein
VTDALAPPVTNRVQVSTDRNTTVGDLVTMVADERLGLNDVDPASRAEVETALIQRFQNG